MSGGSPHNPVLAHGEPLSRHLNCGRCGLEIEIQAAAATAGLVSSGGGYAAAVSTGLDGLSQRLPAEPPSVPILRRRAVAFAAERGATPLQCDDIAVAVSEALTNVVIHAYADRDEPGAMRLNATVVDAILDVVVADDGTGVTQRDDSPGLGIGIGLMKMLTERLEIESNDGVRGARVRMVFEIG